MDELITLNQLKQYDAEKTNKLNVGFNTLNLSASNATVTDLNVSNAVVNSLDVDTVSINGAVGNNGQVLGVVNGKSEWMDIPGLIDADNVYINNLYINNHAKINGFDVTSYTIMAEDDYNNLSRAEKKKPIFYLTQPNGNLYLQEYGYSPSRLPPPPVYSVWVGLNSLNQQMTTHSLILGAAGVTNNFVNGSTIYGVQGDGVWNNSVSIGVNTWGDTVTTNAEELYIYDASYMYNYCRYLTDTFICNPSLITDAPAGYGPMKYCTNMAYTFSRCSNFNQPVTIPDNVTDMTHTFSGCSKFNQPVTIGNSVTDMTRTFADCSNFNQPVTIPDNVTDMTYTFSRCSNFNQPVTIPDNVTDMSYTFADCSSFNQPVTIPNSVTNMMDTFSGCSSFNQPVTIPDNVTDMTYTFSRCSNFNQPVTIPDNVTDMTGTFVDCSNFNQPVTIPDNVTNMTYTFSHCSKFNQPVTIPDNVTNMTYTFSGCSSFNQPVTIPNSVTNMSYTFYNCTALASSTVPIHISHTIALGDTTNYIYNCLVNGIAGIAFDPSRILNDA